MAYYSITLMIGTIHTWKPSGIIAACGSALLDPKEQRKSSKERI